MSTTVASGTAAGASGPRDIVVTEAISGIYRVERRGFVAGYVQLTGERFVSLLGPVYNTSIEVAQTLTLDAAVRRLLAA
jgi:hypothetical protein